MDLMDMVVTGDRRLSARFNEWPAELHDALWAKIRELTAELEARVRALAPERTGRLKSEITTYLHDDPQSMKGAVTIEGGLAQADYIKAAVMEYGAPGRRGRFAVRAYSRTITKLFGRDISPRRIDVSAYTRIARVEARMYLRAGLSGMEPRAVEELTEVMNRQLKD